MGQACINRSLRYNKLNAILYELQVVRVTGCTSYRLYELQVVRVTDCTSYRLYELQVVRVTGCTSYRLDELQVGRVTGCTSYRLYELQVAERLLLVISFNTSVFSCLALNIKKGNTGSFPRIKRGK